MYSCDTTCTGAHTHQHNQEYGTHLVRVVPAYALDEIALRGERVLERQRVELQRRAIDLNVRRHAHHTRAYSRTLTLAPAVSAFSSVDAIADTYNTAVVTIKLTPTRTLKSRGARARMPPAPGADDSKLR
jgi:hypothetical protein